MSVASVKRDRLPIIFAGAAASDSSFPSFSNSSAARSASAIASAIAALLAGLQGAALARPLLFHDG